MGRRAIARLSALFCLAATACGCQPHPVAPRPAALPPRPPVPRAAAAYVDVTRYAALHPAAAQLRGLEGEIARLQRARPTAAVPIPILPPPGRDMLSVPPSPGAAPAPDLRVDAQRARKEIRQEFAAKRLAEPPPGEEAYEAELQRLRRELIRIRRAPLPEPPQPRMEEAVRRAEQMHALERQLVTLRESSEERFLYTPAQIRRRRELYRVTETELDELRRQEVIALRQVLVTPRRPPLQIPAGEMAKAEQLRDRARQEAERITEASERLALSRVGGEKLPSPRPLAVSTLRELAGAEVAAGREEIGAAVGTANQGPVPAARAPATQPPLGSLRAAHAELRRAIAEDLQTAAITAGKELGLRVTFVRGRAPDRTQALLPKVQRLLDSRIAKGDGR